MRQNKIKLIFKERWKFYLIGYILGYIIPLLQEGVPRWEYLFPIKIMGIACALGIGTAFYYGSQQMPVFEIFRKSIKYAIFIVVLILISFIIKEILLMIVGIDITPFIGIPESVD